MGNSGTRAVLSATCWNLMTGLVSTQRSLGLVKVWSLRKRFKLLGCFVDRSADLELPNCQARLRVKTSGMTCQQCCTILATDIPAKHRLNDITKMIFSPDILLISKVNTVRCSGVHLRVA